MNKLAIRLLVAAVLIGGILVAALELGVFGTGYSEDQPLTDGQKAEMEQIALNDRGVQEQLDGHNFTVGGEGYSIDETWYPIHIKTVHPSLQIMVPEQHRYYNVIVDLRKKTVLKIMPDVIPYVPPELNNSTGFI